MIRFIVMLVLVGTLTWCGATVKLGKRPFFGHVKAIWETEPAQDLKDGVKKEGAPLVQDLKEKAGPAAEKLKRIGEAGYREATKDEKPAPGSGSASDQ